MKASLKADLSLVGVTLAWGSSFVVVKHALTLIQPMWLIELRFLIASLALFLIFPSSVKKLDSRTLRAAFWVGLFLFGGFVLQTLGLQYTTPAKSGFLTGVSVPLVPILNRLLFQANLRFPTILGIFLAFTGLSLLTRPEKFDQLNFGDLLTVLCAFCFALHIIAVGRFAVRVPYQKLAILQIVFVSVLVLPLAVLREPPPASFSIPLSLSLIHLGVVCSALAFFVQTHAQQFTSPARTALILSLEPLFAALLSVLFYGERLDGLEWLGGVLIVLGILAGEAPLFRAKIERRPGLDV